MSSNRSTLSVRTCRRALVLGAAAVGASALAGRALPSLAQDKPAALARDTEAIDVSTRVIDTFSRGGDVPKHRYGALEFRGGLVMTSPSSAFGGWSGIELDAGGRRLLAISDAGSWMTAELAYRNGRLSGIDAVRIGPLRGRSAGALQRSRDRDAEGLRLLEGTLAKGRVLITFERNHRIGVFDCSAQGIGAPISYLTLPPEARRMRSNKGLEAVALLRGGPSKGAVVVFAELHLDPQGHHSGWLLADGGAGARRLALTDIGGFEITDALGLDDGGLLVLERRFRWLEGLKIRLRRIDGADVLRSAPMRGDILLEADLGHEIDNLEGLAMHRTAKGETILTLISDDNFNGYLQRNLLLQFAWPDANAPKAAARS